MRKISLRHQPTELPLPMGGAPRAPLRRNRRPRLSLLTLCIVAGAFFIIFGLAILRSTSPMEASQRVRDTGRSALTAEEGQVAEEVRKEALRRQQQQWSSAPPPPTLTLPVVADAGENTKRQLSPTDAAVVVTPTTTTTTKLPAPPTPDPRVFQRTGREGEYRLEEPDRLPGLSISRRTYTAAELLEKFSNVDYIYSFVNGTEANHHYRKEVRVACIADVLRAENETYVSGYPMLVDSAATTTTNDPHGDTRRENRSNQGQPTNTAAVNPFAALSCVPKFMSDGVDGLKTVGSFLESVEGDARNGADNRDRETDELRHSIRSLEQHVQWHRGRVVIVSPGHHPTWVDGARNFLAGVCGGASVQALRSRGTHLRLTTVHQDALMPYGMRLTADSHVIEQHIWRVRNTTAVHVYMNDDYFVNRDVAITDLFNEYGGTIVRTEEGFLHEGEVADKGISWARGVRHAQQFNIQELDVHHEDDLPAKLVEMWTTLGRLENSTFTDTAHSSLPVLKGSNTDEAVDVARLFPAEPMHSTPLEPRRPRRYATHAPFVYCTNMFRFLSTRYEREFASAALHHRARVAADLFLPFLYNAFIMARPWQASPQFLPYLMQLHRSRGRTPTEAPPSLSISLDNVDGCAPATLLAGQASNGCVFGKFSDDIAENQRVVDLIARANPLYFNINAGFKTVAEADHLRAYLHDKFPTPVYLEQAPATTAADPEAAAADGDGEKDATAAAAAAANVVADAVLPPLFDALMALPVVGVVSYEEGVCPLVRSLSLAFAGHHRGRVHVAVQRYGDGEADETLREARTRLRNRVISATPVLKCAYGSAVKVASSARGEGVADVARRVLQASDGAGVVLPSTCGAGDGGAAGLRVRGFVMDARTPHAPVTSTAALRAALSMPGQTLALEDFRAMRVGPDDRDVVLVLAREDAAAKAVHWIDGASENDLLLTYPLPLEAYEDMTTPLAWAVP
ncbi:hypothetical protein ABB37_06701 [Leptomonas pyrrhocoris]|uniref:Stealth protein CR3 conserved region 3 domain-containing protein n=1 Tax=Leptomonas pyrrhocoris TaxID=157538 RepID=A0A0N0DTU3_LEPPY|nr:hypothetical protein ABB37_06701 [Leptomonas pyrrhocoris]KPA77922.1 hypothetical protein ABB37_06701 [Leptomonas pyrrhocoris]|eukprot:XP_015656361.1 hypothetical protein ABB37_06701 [Leptomonas pyrrhocoris]